MDACGCALRDPASPHALFFSEYAVALETALHQRLSRKRVNLVNPRREFFYAAPAEVKDLLVALGDDHVVEYNDTAEAVEWRASDPGRHRADRTAEPRMQPDSEAVLSAVVTHPDADVDGDLSDDGGERPMTYPPGTPLPRPRPRARLRGCPIRSITRWSATGTVAAGRSTQPCAAPWFSSRRGRAIRRRRRSPPCGPTWPRRWNECAARSWGR